MTELTFIADTLDHVASLVADGYDNRAQLQISSKDGPNDVLTQVDTDVQARIVERIRQQFPSDRIVAEEAGLTELPSDTRARTWLIDPIDGTQNFVRGFFPAFGISIGFAVGGEVAAGGVSFPVQRQKLLASRGKGAYINGTPLKVSSTSQVSTARVDIDFSSPQFRAQAARSTEALLLEAGQIRAYSCAVVGFCQVAAGEQDAYVLFGANPWDIAAGQIIVEEAGGSVTRLSGERILPFDGEVGAVVTNGKIHRDCIRVIHSSSPELRV